MINPVKILVNMGPRYVILRAIYEFKRKMGFFRHKFPITYTTEIPVDSDSWIKKEHSIFYTSPKDEKQGNSISRQPNDNLRKSASDIKNGKVRFFYGKVINLGIDYDWVTSPETDFKFNADTHWMNISDFGKNQGDIKQVWEKSRFCYFYDVIRDDFHNDTNSSEFIINEILSWIESNPRNCGPNYKCSQEIAIRIINWTFALIYYKNDEALTSSILNKVLCAIHDQVDHIEKNLSFSMSFVRNNHALTESLLLYFIATIFPDFKESPKWKKKGRKFFLREIMYQVENDGSYIQNSFNYHRISIQLFSLSLKLAEINRDPLPTPILKKMNSSLEFLFNAQDDITGELPNYGPNDGALFFPTSSCSYRDFRPQLQTLSIMLNNRPIYHKGKWDEDCFWLTGKSIYDKSIDLSPKKIIASFSQGGYYFLRENDRFSFIRCTKNKYRPAQADNLNIDIWYNGKNIIRDGGTYSYNASETILSRFISTSAHNTISVNNENQMIKGARFIWYNWSKCKYAKFEEDEEWKIFKGSISAFKHINKNIIHERYVYSSKERPEWKIIDTVYNTDLPIFQHWHPSPEFYKEGFLFSAVDAQNNSLKQVDVPGYFSNTYGIFEEFESLYFKNSGIIKTTIKREG